MTMPSTLLLCGRHSELETLVTRWRLASNMERPQAQVVVIKAERGLGKTRLALELYRWLGKEVDDWMTRRYWPDAIHVVGKNLEVNADPSFASNSVQGRTIC